MSSSHPSPSQCPHDRKLSHRLNEVTLTYAPRYWKAQAHSRSSLWACSVAQSTWSLGAMAIDLAVQLGVAEDFLDWWAWSTMLVIRVLNRTGLWTPRHSVQLLNNKSSERWPEFASDSPPSQGVLVVPRWVAPSQLRGLLGRESMIAHNFTFLALWDSDSTCLVSASARSVRVVPTYFDSVRVSFGYCWRGEERFAINWSESWLWGAQTLSPSGHQHHGSLLSWRHRLPSPYPYLSSPKPWLLLLLQQAARMLYLINEI